MKKRRLVLVIMVIIFWVICGFYTAVVLNKNRIQNKTIAAYGDSITFGQYSTDRNKSQGGWPRELATQTEATVMNEGISGTLAGSVPGFSQNEDALCNRVDRNDFKNLDYLTIAYGTNDWEGGLPIGNDQANKGTFKGALIYSINTIHAKNTRVKIVLLTPIANAMDGQKNANGNVFQDFVGAVQEVGKREHVPVIDLYHDAGITAKNAPEMFWDKQVHPTDSTYHKLGDLVAEKMEQLNK
ncbi:MAG TPA: hypothetical protein DEP42_04420 [Ruminococcaceae bacterium]|nr:hypothetical protein [Oscillospiraceae bacterium]